MRRGFSLPELGLVIAITGLLLVLGLPRLWGALDWVAVNRAASELTTTIAVARSVAISLGMRARIVIRHDSLVVDTLGRDGWSGWRAYPGPAAHGVALRVSNPVVTFHGNGLGWGASNTRVILQRGSHSETITTSRLGRVKRW